MKKLLAITLAILLSTSNLSHAAQELSESSVKSFIKKAVQITAGNRGGAEEFLQKHLNDNARFTTTVTLQLPDLPPQNADSLTLDKAGYIGNLKTAKDTLKNHNATADIKNIILSEDKQQATVRYEIRENGKLDDPNGEQGLMPLDGTSTCTSTIRLNSQGIIQLYNADCQTLVKFTGNGLM